MSQSRVIVALDYPNAAPALEFAKRVSPQDCRLKIGKELFTATGPALVETLVKQGFDIFLDLKFHDIPNTVAQAMVAAGRMGVSLANLHALGGPVMMETAANEVHRVFSDSDRPRLLAVTILTSSTAETLRAAFALLHLGAPNFSGLFPPASRDEFPKFLRTNHIGALTYQHRAHLVRDFQTFHSRKTRGPKRHNFTGRGLISQFA